MKEWIVEPKQMALIRFGVGKYEKIHKWCMNIFLLKKEK